jgi:hypothetical protein
MIKQYLIRSGHEEKARDGDERCEKERLGAATPAPHARELCSLPTENRQSPDGSALHSSRGAEGERWQEGFAAWFERGRYVPGYLIKCPILLCHLPKLFTLALLKGNCWAPRDLIP